MTQDVIRTQDAIPGASMAQLLATYTALTGKTVTRFASRAIGENRVKMALMAAVDAAGHLGVPQGKSPEPLTAEERIDVAAAKGKSTDLPEPDAEPGVDTDDTVNPYTPGSLAHQLWATAKLCKPIQRRPEQPKVEREPGAPKRRFEAVRYKPGGFSTVRESSQRGLVFAAIKAAAPAHVTIEALDKQLGFESRPHVQKLLDKAHVEVAS
jgi:hypothetical protein